MSDDRDGQDHSLIGMVRRLVVKLAQADSLWQLLGYVGAYDEEEIVGGVEAFQGIGFRSRPAAGSTGAEAIAVSVGGEGGHQVIIATRDKSIEIALDDDETAIFNSTGAYAKILKDGSIVLRAAAGKTVSIDDGSGAVALAKKSDLDTLKSVIAAAAVVAGDGGAAFKANIGAGLSGWPVGTTVIKGK